MRIKSLRLMAALAFVRMVGSASSASSGAVSTDRFGYTGTVTRYDTLDDAIAGTNAVASYDIGNRDLSLYIVNNHPFDSNYNVIMGSWWYTIDPSGKAGYGNTRGNSGRGFMQIYDVGSLSVTSFSANFGDFDGTYYTSYTLNVTGANADYANQYARFWIDYQGSGADKVFYHSYALNLTATGLQGVQNGYLIESNNHPTGVTGTLSGIFQNVSTTYPVNNGFYKFNLNLDMDNWAYENRDNLTGDPFAPSYFSTVPGPTAVLPFALGLLAMRRRRRK